MQIALPQTLGICEQKDEQDMINDLRVVQMVIISLRSNCGVRGVGWVVVLPVNVHLETVSRTVRCAYIMESYVVTNDDWSLGNGQNKYSWRSYSMAIPMRIGIASVIASTT